MPKVSLWLYVDSDDNDGRDDKSTGPEDSEARREPRRGRERSDNSLGEFFAGWVEMMESMS
jgi:hypothetical protein